MMYRLMDRLARIFAQLGGIVLSALIVLTCLSVLGRSMNGVLHADWVQEVAPVFAQGLLDLGIGPINGDFELVEAGMAFAIFAFLPLCHLNGAHATVDIFTAGLPSRIKRTLYTVIELVFAAVMVLIAWQLLQGTLSKQSTGQTTFLLEFPVWWAYAASLVAAIMAAFIAVYMAITRVVEALTGQRILPAELGADH